MELNESYYTYRLINWLQNCGVTVEKFNPDLGYSGMYRSETRTIYLNVCNAKDALLCLAHEAGHWLGWQCFGEKPYAYQRERQAVVYGWRVLGLIGATRIVSRQDWIEYHRDPPGSGLLVIQPHLIPQ